MTPEQEKINRWMGKYPWTNKTFFNRPHWTRRGFFELMGAGVTGSFLANRYAKAADVAAAGSNTKGTTQNVIFILLAGAPSHTDTFDFKNINGVTPATFNPTTADLGLGAVSGAAQSRRSHLMASAGEYRVRYGARVVGR